MRQQTNFDKWIRWGTERRRWSHNTATLYQRRARAAHGWMRSQGWSGLSRGRPEHWYSWWSSLPDTPASRNLARNALTAYGDWLVDTGQRATNPAADIPHWREPKAVPRTLSEAEARRVARLVATTTDRTAAGVTLMMYGGLRISEACRVQWRDVVDGWVTVTGKGGQQRRVPLGDGWSVLRRWRLACPSSVWVLPVEDHPIHPNTLRHHVRRWTGHRPHALRHTAATELLTASADLRLVQDFLGHASPATTARYAQVRPNRMADAVQRMYAS